MMFSAGLHCHTPTFGYQVPTLPTTPLLVQREHLQTVTEERVPDSAAAPAKPQANRLEALWLQHCSGRAVGRTELKSKALLESRCGQPTALEHLGLESWFYAAAKPWSCPRSCGSLSKLTSL